MTWHNNNNNNNNYYYYFYYDNNYITNYDNYDDDPKQQFLSLLYYHLPERLISCRPADFDLERERSLWIKPEELPITVTNRPGSEIKWQQIPIKIKQTSKQKHLNYGLEIGHVATTGSNLTPIERLEILTRRHKVRFPSSDLFWGDRVEFGPREAVFPAGSRIYVRIDPASISLIIGATAAMHQRP